MSSSEEKFTNYMTVLDINADEIMRESKEFLLTLIKPGEYSRKEDINPVFNKLTEYYTAKFDECAKKLSTREIVQSLLWTHSKYFDTTPESQKLRQETDWDLPSLHKATMIGIERALLIDKAQSDVVGDEEIKLLVLVQGYANMLIGQYVSSDQIHGVFSDLMTVTIWPEDDTRMMKSKIKSEVITAMNDIDKPKEENERRKKIVTGKDEPQELDIRKSILNEPFKKTLGADFEQVRQIMLTFTGTSKPMFLRKESELITVLSQQSGLAESAVRKILDGFTLTKQKLETMRQSSDLLPWKITKEKMRIARKPLIGLDFEGHYCLFWSPVMVRDLLNYFNGLLAFQEIPKEWQSEEMSAGMIALQKESSDWLEEEIGRLLAKRGFVGRNVKSSIGKTPRQISLGEQIDYLGYHSDFNLLLVCECKLVKWSSEPRDFYDDYCEFVKNINKPTKETYSGQLERKFIAVMKNPTGVVDALISEFPSVPKNTTRPLRVAKILLTYHPMRISVLMNDFPCKSIVRFIDELDASPRDWPYQNGVLSIA